MRVREALRVGQTQLLLNGALLEFLVLVFRPRRVQLGPVLLRLPQHPRQHGRDFRGILLVSSPEGWRIGLPEPYWAKPDLDFEPSLSLSGGRGRSDPRNPGKSRSVSRLVKAGFFTPVPSGLTAFAYCPPFGEGLRVRANVGWLRVTATGFTAP